MTPPEIDPTPLAVIGVRSCDLHALAIQDKVFLDGPYVDPGYKARREVSCGRQLPPGGNLLLSFDEYWPTVNQRSPRKTSSFY
jgi:hypothetical protein